MNLFIIFMIVIPARMKNLINLQFLFTFSLYYQVERHSQRVQYPTDTTEDIG